MTPQRSASRDGGERQKLRSGKQRVQSVRCGTPNFFALARILPRAIPQQSPQCILHVGVNESEKHKPEVPDSEQRYSGMTAFMANVEINEQFDPDIA